MLGLLAFALSASAQQKTEVTEFNLAGPFKVTAPLKFDTVDVKGNKYDEKSQLASLALKAEPTTVFSGKVLPKIEGERSVGVLTFYMTNSDYLKGKLKVKGPKNYKLYIDGKESTGDLNLIPEHHTFAIRYLAEPKETDSISVTFDTQKKVEYTLSKKHTYMFSDLSNGKRVRGMSLSADGSLVVVSYQTTAPGGKSQWAYELRETKTGKLLRMLSSSPRWMPQSIAYLVDEKEGDIRKLYKVNPLTGERTVFADNLPEGSFNISPKEDYLIMSNREEGPKEDAEIYEIVEMDDRQPGWRSRSYLSKFDIATGMTQRITFGSKGETWKEWVRGETTIDGRDYVIYTVLYPDVLTKGQETEALFGTVTLDRTVDIDPDGSWHTLSGGDTALGWSNSDGNPTILVSAYAIQKEKFDTVEAACEAFAAQWGINSTQP